MEVKAEEKMSEFQVLIDIDDYMNKIPKDVLDGIKNEKDTVTFRTQHFQLLFEQLLT